MKKFSIFVICLITLIGCGGQSVGIENADKENVISYTDKIYIAIKTVVTDPEVNILFSEDEIIKLKKIETSYLSLKTIIETDPTDKDSIMKLVSCANDVLIVLGKDTLQNKYGTEITAIRIGIKMLLAMYTT